MVQAVLDSIRKDGLTVNTKICENIEKAQYYGYSIGQWVIFPLIDKGSCQWGERPIYMDGGFTIYSCVTSDFRWLKLDKIHRFYIIQLHMWTFVGLHVYMNFEEIPYNFIFCAHFIYYLILHCWFKVFVFIEELRYTILGYSLLNKF